MKITKVTIDNTTYDVEKVDVKNIITGNQYIFHGIYWYKVIDFNMHNHIKNE